MGSTWGSFWTLFGGLRVFWGSWSLELAVFWNCLSLELLVLEGCWSLEWLVCWGCLFLKCRSFGLVGLLSSWSFGYLEIVEPNGLQPNRTAPGTRTKIIERRSLNFVKQPVPKPGTPAPGTRAKIIERRFLNFGKTERFPKPGAHRHPAPDPIG